MMAPMNGETRKVVLVAALTALATGLVQWGVDELKTRWATKPKCPECAKREE